MTNTLKSLAAAREAMALLFQRSFDNIATQVDSEEAAFTATQTFVATLAPGVVTDTAFDTRTVQVCNIPSPSNQSITDPPCAAEHRD